MSMPPPSPSGPHRVHPQAPPPPEPVLTQRLRRLEHDRHLGLYGTFYAPMILSSFVFIFLSFYEDYRDMPFLPLWEMAAEGHMIGVGSIVLLLILVVLLAVGIWVPRAHGVPVGIAMICGILLLLLVTRAEAPPDAVWSAAGWGGMWFGALGLLLGAAHQVHLLVLAVRG